ncbi:FYVE-domain-containing protein [Daldinia vernicosa]|uniref:FYVE-domain-containing protein n=1 Tax=Daldinia vernicosa TaxID=114800 RepID=UPI00200863B2|nr:FYVE-domain-containing protein [Daldinia vernicosa]KAI0847963.1 FYVE-domain-containing protein [Daldinia vernicosa]
MATDFIMPRPAEQPQAHFYPYRQMPTAPSPSPTYPSQGYHSQQISPLSTSTNASPTSSKSSKPYHRQRLRPLYMPAVLRPTEHPYKRKTEAQEDDNPVSSNSSFISLAGLGALSRLSRRTTGDSGKCVDDDDDDEWDLDMFPKPTAQPTRQHWKPDTESTICDEPSCMRHFNYWTRRHHCRKCGNIFCDSHSAYDVPLDQDANYNPRGTPSRACSHCFSEFKAWRSRTNSQASSDTSSTGRESQTAPSSPAASAPTAIQGQNGHDQDIAASVPRDWNWSTF